MYKSSLEINSDFLAYCNEILSATLSDINRVSIIEELGGLNTSLEEFIRGYEKIEDSSIDTDDEILNWVFAEAQTDFRSALWLLASGFYKASASSLRNAFDIAISALYFQIRENADPETGGFNRFFAEWDRGDRQTPNWGEMKTFIAKQTSVSDFKAETGTDIVEIVYDHFRSLCAYTHTSAFTSAGETTKMIIYNLHYGKSLFLKCPSLRGPARKVKNLAILFSRSLTGTKC